MNHSRIVPVNNGTHLKAAWNLYDNTQKDYLEGDFPTKAIARIEAKNFNSNIRTIPTLGEINSHIGDEIKEAV